MASNMDTIGTFEMAKMLSKVCQVITELLHTHTLPFKKIFSLCYNSGVAINWDHLSQVADDTDFICKH